MKRQLVSAAFALLSACAGEDDSCSPGTVMCTPDGSAVGACAEDGKTVEPVQECEPGGHCATTLDTDFKGNTYERYHCTTPPEARPEYCGTTLCTASIIGGLHPGTWPCEYNTERWNSEDRVWGSITVPVDRFNGSLNGVTTEFELPQFKVPADAETGVLQFGASTRIFTNTATSGGMDENGIFTRWLLDSSEGLGDAKITVTGIRRCTTGVPAVQGSLTATYVRCVGAYSEWTCDPVNADSAIHVTATFE
jgi:hypothetical protein